MKLSLDEIENWKFIGDSFVRCWVYIGSNNNEKEVYIESDIRKHPQILSNRLWFEIQNEDEIEYFTGIVNGSIEKTSIIYDKKLLTNIELLFFELYESLWNPKVIISFNFDKDKFLNSLIDNPSMSELMFVVIAHNLNIESEKIINAKYSVQRGIEAALNYLDSSYIINPPIESWEATI